ncbi:PQQ-binding-like beta-propeller repeat protein [Microbulbifer sp. EKSA008]|uniref:outer membrane protein assembly factor BamB family protein n=1 Tax=Microbulbifer sp. EKSA008 TaxID=3243367 RepID=UPI0040431C2A
MGLSSEELDAAEMALVSESPLSAPEGGAELEIRAFSALPEKLFQPGDSSGLSWSVLGATTVTLINNSNGTRIEGLQAKGVVRVAPTTTTTYTLFANGPSGSKTAQIQVTLASGQPSNLWESGPPAKSMISHISLQQVQLQPESIGASLTALEDNSVYQGNFDGNYYHFSADGELTWTLDDIGVVMSQAAVSNGIAYVGVNKAEGGRVFAVKADKSILWQVHTESGVIASPILSPDHSMIYAVSYSGTIYALNIADGSEQWRYQLPGGETVSTAPTLSEDGSVLYIHSTNHKVFALKNGFVPNTSPETLYPIPDGPTIAFPAPDSEALPEQLQQPVLLWQRDLQP